MKALLVGEYREGRLLDSTNELLAFAAQLGAETSMFLVGSESEAPKYAGTLYLADAATYGEFNPTVHKDLLLRAVEMEKPDLVVFAHSSYGWDLAPRLAIQLGAAQISEVVGVDDGAFVLPACNAKLRRSVRPKTGVAVVTVQSGAFSLEEEPEGVPQVTPVEVDQAPAGFEFVGYEAAEQAGVDLGKAEVVVSAGRGIGKPENIAMVSDLATALGGEYGASRPVVDAGWADQDRQVGSTGQTVVPKLYVACGISGAVQHLMGMKKSEFVVAVNSDKDAPIGEVADVLVVADLKEFVPAFTKSLQG